MYKRVERFCEELVGDIVIVQESGTLLFGVFWGVGGGDKVGNKNPFAASSTTQKVWDLGT